MKGNSESMPTTTQRLRLPWRLLIPAIILLSLLSYSYIPSELHTTRASVVSRCRALQLPAGPPHDFHSRTQSDRHVPGTRPYLIQNAKLWTGLDNGTQIIQGDVLIDRGLIKGVGSLSALRETYGSELVVIDAKGAWVTPGIVDIHSHLGDSPSPELEGAVDDNSPKGPIQPWLRSLDGLNTHDDAYPLSIAGGVTTALVLPGSLNAIGGQAFPIKLRKTKERSSTSMLLEPPYQINSSAPDPSLPPRWRHMKHACGENPRWYGNTRMDTIYAFREAYNTANQIKQKQDTFCNNALSGQWEGLGEFPESLQWEALVDVLRGRVKVNIHCYEAVDFDGIVRLSNEFKFPIAAFHHAHESYLVPNLIKKAYGSTPAIALFATNARYKREAYRGSEFAPRILAEHGLTALMKSDHPVMNSRHLLYEAQQAYYYGLPGNLALASITSNSAQVMGMGHRVGYIRQGWDADIVIWDSHPLALGATPVQVFIDGIPQLSNPHIVEKPETFQRKPPVPNFDAEVKEAVKYDGLPPLVPTRASTQRVIFVNVRDVFTSTLTGIEKSFSAADDAVLGTVITENGQITCVGLCSTHTAADSTVIDLEGGSISPGLVSFGSPLGLEHIAAEASTIDGPVYDPLSKQGVPDIVGGDGAIVRAVDGLIYETRDALLAYRAGVTSAIVAPTAYGTFGGLGVAFSLAASHKLERGAVLQEVTGVHMKVSQSLNGPSVSTQIALLRKLLLHPVEGQSKEWFLKVREGEIPLVVEAHSADIIATLILLKREIESASGRSIQLTITGASEAHILARELGEAGVGIILNPARSFPYTWEERRILPGPPLTESTPVSTLMAHNVTVGLGVMEIWDARNLRFDAAWASLAAGGHMSKEEVLALGSTNINKLLIGGNRVQDDLIATRGGDLLDMSSKVVAVISAERGLADLL
ncbi:carbohydrate esterase family 9 protein [Roridomyces roridus]|uniref:Carbohydrate esterase family 9 protein n=1 Tax=Roridomyces roridus TaxID=1738132 RepID=A0AAD7CJT3_9AGAR|nr:carbohydrate esterase family 9 protein [Roridomyces roridus]